MVKFKKNRAVICENKWAVDATGESLTHLVSEHLIQ